MAVELLTYAPSAALVIGARLVLSELKSQVITLLTQFISVR